MDFGKEKNTPKCKKCFPLSFEIKDDFLYFLFWFKSPTKAIYDFYESANKKINVFFFTRLTMSPEFLSQTEQNLWVSSCLSFVLSQNNVNFTKIICFCLNKVVSSYR